MSATSLGLLTGNPAFMYMPRSPSPQILKSINNTYTLDICALIKNQKITQSLQTHELANTEILELHGCDIKTSNLELPPNVHVLRLINCSGNFTITKTDALKTVFFCNAQRISADTLESFCAQCPNLYLMQFLDCPKALLPQKESRFSSWESIIQNYSITQLAQGSLSSLALLNKILCNSNLRTYIDLGQVDVTQFDCNCTSILKYIQTPRTAQTQRQENPDSQAFRNKLANLVWLHTGSEMKTFAYLHQSAPVSL